MRWRTPAILLFAVALIGAGYVYLPAVGWSDSEAEARQRVTDYLKAVALDSGDRGWGLLHPDGRRTYGSESAYRQMMDAADWTDFAWEFGESARCDDGVCTFLLGLPNGRGSVPDVVWSTGPADPGFLLSTKDSTGSATEAGEAYIEVLQRGWFGGIGVVVFGAITPSG
jgi:hypothetical protein